jgi:HEAT repeat protein
MERNWIGAVLMTGLLAGGCGAPAEGPALVHGKPAAHWVKELGAADAKARRQAVRVLGNAGLAEPDVVSGLLGALKDRTAEVRLEAVAALEKLGPRAPEVLPALAAAQRDGDARVRSRAAAAVAQLQTGS